MSNPVYKKIDVVGTSTNSFSEAAANAIAKAGETVRNISWFEVVEQRGSVMEGMVQQYQTTVRIGFRGLRGQVRRVARPEERRRGGPANHALRCQGRATPPAGMTTPQLSSVSGPCRAPRPASPA